MCSIPLLLLTAALVLAAPFCLLQLALCRNDRLCLLPLFLLCGGFHWSFGCLTRSPRWKTLPALPVMLLSLLGLTGCGLGLTIWTHLHKGPSLSARKRRLSG